MKPEKITLILGTLRAGKTILLKGLINKFDFPMPLFVQKKYIVLRTFTHIGGRNES